MIGSVLIVENNALVAMDLREHLAIHGFGQALPTGDLGIAELFADEADLAFGLIATEIAGHSTASIARRLRARSIAFAYITSYPDGRDRPPEFGDAPFVAKPFAEAEIVDLIEQLSSGCRSLSSIP